MASEKKKKIREWMSQHEGTVIEFNDLRKSLEVLDTQSLFALALKEITVEGLERINQTLIDEVIKSRGLLPKPKEV